MKTRHPLRAAIAALTLFNSLTLAADNSPTIVAPPYATGDISIVSPRGAHVATVTLAGSRHVVLIDGKAGAPFDDILSAAAEVQDVMGPNGTISSRAITSAGPVAFSPDGSRYAYAARLEKEVLVIVDGQEMFRAPYSPSAPVVSMLRFSPDSKHDYFLTATTDTMNSSALVMDGKPQAPTQNGAFPVFTADGAHYAYVATEPRENKSFLVIDGQVAPYAGDRPRFMPDGKLVTLLRGNGGDTIQVDGKPLLNAKNIDGFLVSPTENKVAAVASKDGKTKSLFINEQAVPDTEGASLFTFSPDGKRWALQCFDSPNSWMVIDGKKGQTYGSVGTPLFTADSSKVIYIADSGNKHFAVVNGQEELGGIYVRVAPKVAGSHYAYVIGDALNTMQVVYDGQATPPGPDVMDVFLSDDGSRHGYFGKGGIMDYTVVIDGKPQTGSGGDYRFIFFSPGGKHYATIASPPKGYQTLLIDGQYVPVVKGVQPGEPLFFTPDGEHLFTKTNEPTPTGGPGVGIYMDGKLISQFDGYSRNWPRTVMWDCAPDGTVTLIGGVPTANKPGPVQRLTIDPKSAGTTVASIVANAQAAQAALDKADADAKAAKAQADADAKAARDKAAADAAAAKAQARADAAAAKAKAKADAAAARAAKKKPQ